METEPHFNYWETQILTSTPQKLRLLLIEGAINFGRQAVEHWQASRIDAGFKSASRCQDILFELLGNVRANGSTLNHSVTEIYLFLVKEIQLAIRHRDSEVMSRILRVLAEERATWQLVCERYPQPLAPAESQPDREITARHLPAIEPDGFHLGAHAGPGGSHGTFSLDA